MSNVMRLGEPLPDWFSDGMSEGRIIISSYPEPNSPFDHTGELRAYVWDGDEIRVAYVGDYIRQTGNGTYTVEQGDSNE